MLITAGLLICMAGLSHAAYATDWAESQEVRSRLDQLKARPMRPSPTVIFEDHQDSSNESTQISSKPWRKIAYDTVAPPGPPNRHAASSGKKIEVAEADKLGYQLNNSTMREKVLELYRRPDIVVEQYVIGQ